MVSSYKHLGGVITTDDSCLPECAARAALPSANCRAAEATSDQGDAVTTAASAQSDETDDQQVPPGTLTTGLEPTDNSTPHEVMENVKKCCVF